MHGDVIIIRLIFTGILIAAGYVLKPIAGDRWISAGVGALIAICIVLFELRIRRATLKTLIGAAVGSIMGIVGAFLIGSLISRQESMAVAPEVKTFVTLALTFFMAYVGLMVGAAKGDYLELSALGGILTEKASRRDLKILDTSVIIDGRIADVAETGFLTGSLIIPQFILRELQQVAEGVNLHDAVGERACEGERGTVERRFRRGRIGKDQTTTRRCGHEQHAQKHQTATEEDRRKKLVFLHTEAVTQVAKEPHEGNTGKWYEVEGNPHSSGARQQPRANLQWIRRNRKAKQPEATDQQHRKHNSGNRGSARCPQTGADQRLVGRTHISVRHAPLLPRKKPFCDPLRALQRKRVDAGRSVDCTGDTSANDTIRHPATVQDALKRAIRRYCRRVDRRGIFGCVRMRHGVGEWIAGHLKHDLRGGLAPLSLHTGHGCRTRGSQIAGLGSGRRGAASDCHQRNDTGSH